MPQQTTDQSNSQYQTPSSPALTTDFQGLIFEGLNQSNEATMYVEQGHE